jgi:hypothetical protein
MGWVAQYVGSYLKQIATENAVGVLQSIRLGGDRVYRQSSCRYLLRMGLPLLLFLGISGGILLCYNRSAYGCSATIVAAVQSISHHTTPLKVCCAASDDFY